MVLNTSNLSIAEHKAFLEETLKKNPDANWNVVCFHKSMYSVASHVTEEDIVQLRTGLSPIFKELGIDVVLQGHDHVYARSYIMGGKDGMTADVQKNADGTATFTDLRKGAYYEKAVIWAAENGIAQGYDKNTFAPDQTISRQQMAAFLYRYAKLQGMDITGQSDLSGFKDSKDVGKYAETAMAWAVDAGIVQGTTSSTLSPKAVLPRQQHKKKPLLRSLEQRL